MNIEKQEKKEIRELLFAKIDATRGDRKLSEIYQCVSKLNDLVNDKDTKFENMFDAIGDFFTTSQKGKIKNKIDDALDKYDKVQKDGKPFYSDETKAEIKQLIEKIDEICNKSFIERMANMINKGS